MTIPDLFKDLVDEILCRVPTTSLKQLRSTCKRWNRLFKDDWGFAREHFDKAAKEFLFLMLTKKFRICHMSVNLHGDIPSLEVKRELSVPDPHFNNSKQFDIAHVFHCDGLLLCAHEGTPRYGSKIVVWNPITAQTRWIEAGHRCPAGNFVLGYCQDKKSCRSYKILSFQYCAKETTEIYDFKSDSWRRIHDCISPSCWSLAAIGRMVSLKGNAYFFGGKATKPNEGIYLLKFDFSTEKISLCVPLPKQCPMYESLSLSVVRGEKLSVLLQPNCTSKTEIWVTNKIDETTKAVAWTKVLALDLSPDLEITCEVSFLLDEEKKVAMCCERWLDIEDERKSKDRIYVVGEDNKVTEVDFGVDTTEGCWPVILEYVPSLVQIEQAGCKRKRGKAPSDFDQHCDFLSFQIMDQQLLVKKYKLMTSTQALMSV